MVVMSLVVVTVVPHTGKIIKNGPVFLKEEKIYYKILQKKYTTLCV